MDYYIAWITLTICTKITVIDSCQAQPKPHAQSLAKLSRCRLVITTVGNLHPTPRHHTLQHPTPYNI